MGMTDKQFNSFLKLFLRFIKQAIDAKDENERVQKLKEIADQIQDMIED